MSLIWLRIARFELASRTSSLSRTRLDSQSLGVVDDSLPREIFNRIFNGFEREFDSNKVNVYRTTDLRTLKRELKHIQNDQERTRTLRNLRRIEPFIVKFEQYGGVLQSILGTAELMGFIWGPVKELIQVRVSHVILSYVLLSCILESQTPGRHFRRFIDSLWRNRRSAAEFWGPTWGFQT